jgi:DHA2 family multidrug resistance protein-like MFS transporter
VGAALLDAARSAFTDGLQLAAGVSAATVAATAVLGAAMLRRARAGREQQARAG